MSRSCYIIIILIVCITLSSCGVFEDDDSESPHTSYSGSGSILFDDKWQSKRDIITVDISILDQENNLQLKASWPIDECPDKIDDIPAGPGKKLIMSGKNINDFIECRGESNNFNLNNEQTVDLGEIFANRFVPSLITPKEKGHLNGESVNFEWSSVTDATQYRILILKFRSVLIDEVISAPEYYIPSFSDLLTSPEDQTNADSDGGDFIPFPDTGQTEPYVASDTDTNIPYGQDSHYSTGGPSYARLYANGVNFPVSVPISITWQVSSIGIEGEESEKEEHHFDLIWGMVKDNITGLVWDVKTNDDSIHDLSNVYSFNEAQNFINLLNTNNFGKIPNWRLVSI